MKNARYTKNRYRILILTYGQRRDAVRKELKKVYAQKRKLRYKIPASLMIKHKTLQARLRNYTKRLRTYYRAIRRIEEKQQKVLDIVTAVQNFTGQSVRFDQLSRGIFCKYAIEQGLNGPALAGYLKVSKYYPSIIRRQFTRSFKINKQHYEIWQRFRQKIAA